MDREEGDSAEEGGEESGGFKCLRLPPLCLQFREEEEEEELWRKGSDWKGAAGIEKLNGCNST